MLWLKDSHPLLFAKNCRAMFEVELRDLSRAGGDEAVLGMV